MQDGVSSYEKRRRLWKAGESCPTLPTGGILALSTVEDPWNWDTYFLKIDNAKFKAKVSPGDILLIKMELLSPIRRGICHMQGIAYVDNKIVSEAELTAQIIRRKVDS
jgi:UDP-3-O-[3-hydroxymyristoyl] N-acetylglucosamine deacetylase/3-hydroxyacyl-[acyl-carrier-protein] dehydratase